MLPDIDFNTSAVWSLLLATGYLKATDIAWEDDEGQPLEFPVYTSSITNYETRIIFEELIQKWFTTGCDSSSYDEFIKALRGYDLPLMNHFLGKVALQSFSYFDTANKTPEAFWQGFVIGLAVSLEKDYTVTSNRIAGLGRYDVQLKPRDKSNPAFILEALKQIEDNQYYTELVTEGYQVIHKLGIAFKGQLCLIGDARSLPCSCVDGMAKHLSQQQPRSV